MFGGLQMLHNCRVILLGLLASLLLASCSRCPKVAVDRDFEVQIYAFEEGRFALPADYEQVQQETDNQPVQQWKGPRGMVRFYVMNPTQHFDDFRLGFMEGVRMSYQGIPTRTIPTEQVWGEHTLVGNQLEVKLKDRSLALDFVFIPGENHMYAVCFQRLMAKDGSIDSEFLPVEALFWRSLCLK